MALSFLKKPKIETPKIGLTSGTGSHKYWKKYKNAVGKWIYIYKKPGGSTTTSPAQAVSPTRSAVATQATSGAQKVSSRPVPKTGTNATAAKKSDRPVPKPGTVEAKIDAGSQAVAASMQAAGVKPSNRPNAREKTVSEGTANVKKGEKVDTKNPLSDQGTVNASAHGTAQQNNKNKADSKSSEVSSAGVPKDENGNLDFSQFHREVEKADVEKADVEKAKNSKSTKSSGGGSSRSTSNQGQQTQQNNSSGTGAGTGNATLADESEESKKLKEVYSNVAELVKSGTINLDDLPENIREEVEKLADPEGYELKRLEAVYGDFVKQIENGKISIDDVPETIREDVQKVLTAHSKESGPNLDVPLSEIDPDAQEIKEAESFVDELLGRKEEHKDD